MGTIQFKPYLKVYLQEQDSKVIINRPFQDNQLGIVYELSMIGIKLFRLIGTGLTREETTQILLQEDPNCGDEIDEIFEVLFEERYIEEQQEFVEELYRDMESEYSRLVPIWAEFETKERNRYQIQEIVMAKKIGVIGCGTIGFGVISKLTAFGISNFVLFDSDTVERSNLARQTLFSLEDIGVSKVDCVETFIKKRKPQAQVTKIRKDILQVSDLKPLEQCDLVVIAGDTPSYKELGYIVQIFCFKHNIPIAFAGGYKAHVGKIYPIVIPYETACFHCINAFVQQSDQLGERLKNQTVKVSTTVQMGDTISNIVSFEIIKYLTGVIEPYLINKILIVDLATYEKTEIEVPRLADCSHCQESV